MDDGRSVDEAATGVHRQGHSSAAGQHAFAGTAPWWLRTASRQGVGGLAGLADGGTDYRAAARPSNGTGRLTLPGESEVASLPPPDLQLVQPKKSRAQAKIPTPALAAASRSRSESPTWVDADRSTSWRPASSRNMPGLGLRQLQLSSFPWGQSLQSVKGRPSCASTQANRRKTSSAEISPLEMRAWLDTMKQTSKRGRSRASVAATLGMSTGWPAVSTTVRLSFVRASVPPQSTNSARLVGRVTLVEVTGGIDFAALVGGRGPSFGRYRVLIQSESLRSI